MSTPLPPGRSAGLRSTAVDRKPRRTSQYASVGPAMLAPEMRMRGSWAMGASGVASVS
jgi:hypothetical protein